MSTAHLVGRRSPKCQHPGSHGIVAPSVPCVQLSIHTVQITMAVRIKRERQAGSSLSSSLGNNNSKPDSLLGIHPGDTSKESDVSMERGGTSGRATRVQFLGYHYPLDVSQCLRTFPFSLLPLGQKNSTQLVNYTQTSSIKLLWGHYHCQHG